MRKKIVIGAGCAVVVICCVLAFILMNNEEKGDAGELKKASVELPVAGDSRNVGGTEASNGQKEAAEKGDEQDTEPPVIEGVKELTITAGESVSYKKGVTVTDNCSDNVKLEVDVSEVDTDRAGDYKVVYTAVDDAGNVAEEETVIHVLEASSSGVTQEMIDEEADRILAELLTDDMSQYEKAEAIYWWCYDNIINAGGASYTNPIDGAFQGLAYRKGDCYTYAMTAKCLLTRAGIKNMDIERIPSEDMMHYWNLIDIGEGWYHFDTCKQADGETFFYKTDEELKKYSDAHGGTHEYDPSLYPEIQ